MPRGASGSSTTRATSAVPAATPDQASGGETFSPSQVNRSGIAAPALNAGLDTVMRWGRARSSRGVPPPDEHAANPANPSTSSHRIAVA